MQLFPVDFGIEEAKRNDAKIRDSFGSNSMRDLKFSIIVVNYNYGHFLSEAISSALAVQTTEKEVVVVDDGSTDESAAVIESFGARIVGVFKANGGALSSVNEGFRHCRGDIVIFLDADDRLHPDVAQNVLSVWDEATAKVQYLANVIGADGRSLGRIQPNLTRISTPAEILQSVVASTNYVTSACSANAYARWFLEEVLPLPAYAAHRNSVDNLLNPVAPFYGKVITLPVPLCDYRHHGTNDGVLGQFDLDKTLRMIERDKERSHFVRKKAAERGSVVDPNALLRCPYHLVSAIAIRKHSPALCPYVMPMWKLAISGIRATAQYRCFGALEKMVLIGWLSCVALAPRSAALWLIGLRYVPSIRPRWVTHLISAFRIKRKISTAGASD
jgi:glycosyltransferase involved in cell wall biosynthesis